MNIQEHVEGHANRIINKKKRVLDVGKTVNFVASIDVAQFIMQGYETQEDIDEVMSKMLEDIIQNKYTFSFRNGTRKNKNGVEKQKYRKTTIDLTNTVSAYHNVSVNEYTSVEPHFHILFEENEFYFPTLQTVLQNEASKKELVFNFAEVTRVEHDFSPVQQLAAKRFSWMIQIKDDDELKTLIDSEQFDESLRFFLEYTKKRDLIAMAIKAMSYLKYRLETLNLDRQVMLDEKTYNLKESYPLDIRESDYLLLEKLKNGNSIDVFPRESVLSREYLKHCFGFKSELMEELEFIGYEIPMQDKDKVKNRFESNIKLKPKYDQSKESDDQKPENVFLTHVKQCIHAAASSSKNKKEFSQNLKTVGEYQTVTFLYRSRRITGLKLITLHNSVTKEFKFDFNRHKMSYEKDIKPRFTTALQFSIELLPLVYEKQKPVEETYHRLEISKFSALPKIFEDSDLEYEYEGPGLGWNFHR